jgi:2-oxoglutarate ferredoxin oxidoreductase subunit alpha
MNPAGSPARLVLIDGSRLIVESLARAGADTFVGYPITPANLMYSYGFRRMPVALAAPDEITTLQWMAGFAASGRLPVTATSFPGFALMIESLNMAHMMELPLVVVLAQRLGPSTGSATASASGDLLLLQGMISGGHAVPVLCPADLADCWELAALSLRTAVSLRSPVVLLTSKEMAMTQRSFDLGSLAPVEPVVRPAGGNRSSFVAYAPGPNLVPDFLPVGNPRHQVRLTASTHDQAGIVQNLTPEAMTNTRRLHEKAVVNLPAYTRVELDEQAGAETLVVAWDVTALAARHAVTRLREAGTRVSLCIPKTLLPVPPVVIEALARHSRVIVAEENLTGQLRQILCGVAGRSGVSGVNAVGRPVTPGDIMARVNRDD